MATIPQMNQLVMYKDMATGLDYAGDIGETTPVSWQPRGDLRFEEWQAIGNTLQQVNASLNWWIGDWLNYGEQRWGEMYAQAIEITGWTYETLAKAKWVCGKIKFCRRRQNLKFSHHAEVASLEPDEQAAWLNRAAVEGWSVRRLRDEIKGLSEIPAPSLSLSEPDDVPFNHKPRIDVPARDWTAVDEYEQGPRPDVKHCDKCGNIWMADIDYCPYCNHTVEERIAHLNGNGSVPHVAHNSGNNEWYTPKEYTEAARRVLGGIDLDPASSELANSIVGAAMYYTAAQDGLKRSWQGRVWMNPPYAADLVGKFADKLVADYSAGLVDAAIVLVNNATETQWFQTLASEAKAICFPRSRIRFWSPDGTPGAPLQGQALLYLGPDRAEFYAEFGRFGFVGFLP